MPRRRRERLNGPYKHRNRWRVNHVRRDGEVIAHYFASEKEALAFIAKGRAQIAAQEVTVGKVIDAYLDHCRTKGNRGRPSSERTIKTTGYRLRGFFGDLDVPIATITTRRGERLYKALAKRVNVDTHRNTLGQAKTFARWCVRQGHWRTSPLEEIEGEGQRSTGKEQLNADEARAFMEHCLERAPGDDAAVAALLCLLVGLRASQACGLTGRDVGQDGSWVRIGKATRKSRAGEGRREVPEVLALHLARLRRGRGNEAIFGGDRHWLYRECGRLCEKVAEKIEDPEFPVVRPHGLRGTHSTLAAEAGVTGHIVAASLGHSSYAVTERHYAKPAAVAGAKARKVLAVIGGGKK
jgi:integrase